MTSHTLGFGLLKSSFTVNVGAGFFGLGFFGVSLGFSLGALPAFVLAAANSFFAASTLAWAARSLSSCT